MFELNEKVALVTGAASGLGQAIAVVLARRGADVAISDKCADKLLEAEDFIKPTGRKVARLAIDVRDLEQV